MKNRHVVFVLNLNVDENVRIEFKPFLFCLTERDIAFI